MFRCTLLFKITDLVLPRNQRDKPSYEVIIIVVAFIDDHIIVSKKSIQQTSDLCFKSVHFIIFLPCLRICIGITTELQSHISRFVQLSVAETNCSHNIKVVKI